MASVCKNISFFIFLSLWVITGQSQTCSTLGQNPSTAFPVCGATTFLQKTVPLCNNSNVPAIGCTNTSFPTVNPYWYKFTCYSAGSLGFIITPLNTLPEDYDWQLFDITGHDPLEVFSNSALIVTANWAGTYGPTGAGPTGQKVFECGSDPKDNISTIAKMPDLIVGHEYLLLISHFLQNSTSEVGYSLSFQGGTASIVNPIVPTLQNANAVCTGTDIILTINKRINCVSVAGDGSDFSITGPTAISIISASANGCNNGFDGDTIILKLNKTLSAGTYTITAKLGIDGNTLTDNCSNSLAIGANTSFKFLSAQPAPLDSSKPIICMTDTLLLVFSKPINCNAIAPDGSDFVITGPTSISIKSAKGVCTNGISSVISILLNNPIKVNGKFTIRLVNGSDGNSLIDECGFSTPIGSTLSFTTQNIVLADFQNVVKTGCKFDTLSLSHNGNGGANKWAWSMDSIAISPLQNPILISKAFGNHTVKLVVTNGKCSDSAFTSVIFPDQTIKASFSSLDTLCPTDPLLFTDLSSPNTISWNWNFGNGMTSNSKTPIAQSYPINNRIRYYTARLSVQNNLLCSDTAFKTITVLVSCYIDVPTAFTPNGDGLNDYLYPLNAYKGGNLYFRVYNRFGQIIFETKDWTRKWDGRLNGIIQPSGTYVWTLSYTNKDTGQPVFLSGTTVLIR